MALTYSLKYKKLNFFNKLLLEKEGEVVLDRQSFRLKGKGAQDLGQVIYFGDIKDLFIRKDYLTFTTYTKEKYVLSDFSNLFDSFLKDFIRVKNEFLSDTLFMKAGTLIREYEAYVEIVNIHEKIIPKGRCRVQFYEGSIVFLPDIKETFAVYYNFMKNHEFDDEEYVLRLYMENGQTINISKLGTQYEEVQETMEAILGKLYERMVSNLSDIWPDLDAGTLLKTVNKFKDFRFVQITTLKRIHEEIPVKVETLVSEKHSLMKEKMSILRKMSGDQNFYVSFSLSKNIENSEVACRSWFMCAIPENNIIATGQTSDAADNTVHFFRIIMQQGDAIEKLGAKVKELDQSLYVFKGDFTPIIKDRRELRKGKFRNAIKKLSFVRLLRKSYLGSSTTLDLEKFRTEIESVSSKSKKYLEVPAVAAVSKPSSSPGSMDGQES